MITKQMGLFDNPRPPAPRDPSVAPAARPRLMRQAVAILQMLRTGPQTARDLTAITHRFGGRIYDLRKAGCHIDTDVEQKTGVSTYMLIHEPEGLTP